PRGARRAGAAYLAAATRSRDERRPPGRRVRRCPIGSRPGPPRQLLQPAGARLQDRPLTANSDAVPRGLGLTRSWWGVRRVETGAAGRPAPLYTISEDPGVGCDWSANRLKEDRNRLQSLDTDRPHAVRAPRKAQRFRECSGSRARSSTG